MSAILLAYLLGLLTPRVVSGLGLVIARANPDLHLKVIRRMEGIVARERAIYDENVNQERKSDQ